MNAHETAEVRAAEHQRDLDMQRLFRDAHNVAMSEEMVQQARRRNHVRERLTLRDYIELYVPLLIGVAAIAIVGWMMFEQAHVWAQVPHMLTSGCR